VTFTLSSFPDKVIRLDTEGWLMLACFETTAHQQQTTQTRVAGSRGDRPVAPTLSTIPTVPGTSRGIPAGLPWRKPGAPLQRGGRHNMLKLYNMASF
jgi:hypothetical protein